MLKNKSIVIFLLVFVITLLSFSSQSHCKGLVVTPRLKITNDGLDFYNTTGFDSLNKENLEEYAINNLLSEYRYIVAFGSAIAILTLMAIFIINLMKLGNSRGNPQARQKAIVSLVVTGIAIALLGSVTLIVTLSYNFVSS